MSVVGVKIHYFSNGYPFDLNSHVKESHHIFTMSLPGGDKSPWLPTQLSLTQAVQDGSKFLSWPFLAWVSREPEFFVFVVFCIYFLNYFFLASFLYFFFFFFSFLYFLSFGQRKQALVRTLLSTSVCTSGLLVSSTPNLGYMRQKSNQGNLHLCFFLGPMFLSWSSFFCPTFRVILCLS